MSGPLDPTQTSTVELTKEEVRRRIKAIATVRMGEKWTWGLEPYSRSNPPPAVSNVLFFADISYADILSHVGLLLLPFDANGTLRAYTEVSSPSDRGRL